MMKPTGVMPRHVHLACAVLGLCAAFLVQGCSYREALSGKHENSVNGHLITVLQPCQLFTENMTRIENVPGRAKYEYTCGRTSVSMLVDENLTVNGKSYGKINEGDAIVFDHGKVLINAREVQEVAAR